MEKNNNPKTKLSTPHPHPIPTSEFIMLVNVFQETYFGNESFFSQERITSDLLWSVTATAWCIGGSIQRGMWYISIQYAHAHTHTHTQHTHKLYGALVVLSGEVCGTSAKACMCAHTHTRKHSCMVQWWFYPERYVVHQHAVYTHTHTHTHTHKCMHTLTNTLPSVTVDKWIAEMGSYSQRYVVYIGILYNNALGCTHADYMCTHTHTYFMHSPTQPLVCLHNLLRWVE